MKQLTFSFSFYLFLFVRRVAYGVFWLLQFVFPKNKVVILCYHSVGTDSWRYTVSQTMLAAQMIYMLKHYEPVTVADIASYIRGEITFSKPVFAVTFDDGYLDIMQTVNMFLQFGIKPAAFVLSEPDKVNKTETQQMRPFLSIADMQTLQKAGWIIGSHSATHPDFSTLSVGERESEISASRATLEAQLHSPIAYFAYPKGRYTHDVLHSVERAGYRAAFSMDDRIISAHDSSYTIARVGVDHTHTLFEFESTISTPAVLARSVVKALLAWKEKQLVK